MIKVVIIGSGNVAQNLIKAFNNPNVFKKGIHLVQVFSRQKTNLIGLIESSKIVSDFNSLTGADVYIIAVSDHAIAEVAKQLPFNNRLVVHTSGSISMSDLSSNNRQGVLYPLQTFSKAKTVDFSTIPICIEAENDLDLKLLFKIGEALSNKIFEVSSSQRKALHVAAVFVNNFVNHLYQIGNEICVENHLPFDILKPLILETAEKIKYLSPNEVQTGPAKRLDIDIINAHLEFINDENQKNIYKLLTQSILEYDKKL